MAKANAKKASASVEPSVATPENVEIEELQDEPITGIDRLQVEGFKSLREMVTVDIRPLTILAGANSSGKSSLMQPLLLLKQTLEAASDPGVFLLDGPNVRFTAADQILSKFGSKRAPVFVLGFRTISGRQMALAYARARGGGFEMRGMEEANQIGGGQTFKPIRTRELSDGEIAVTVAERGFLVERKLGKRPVPIDGHFGEKLFEPLAIRQVRNTLLSMIHVPAMHGNPERNYRATGTGPTYPGTFEPYVASVIRHWQHYDKRSLTRLCAALQSLGLTWKVEAASIDDTRLELRVGRLKKKTASKKPDLVSIADVGFGVSQCLPVLVALLVAREGQLVYIEEPEMHLHPRAQVALARILADAAKRGVRVVIETHSSLLLLAVQTLVAEEKMSPDLVALHWFSLEADGATRVRSAELDETGAFGDWPEDFAEVTLDAQAQYLDAAEKRSAEQQKASPREKASRAKGKP